MAKISYPPWPPSFFTPSLARYWARCAVAPAKSCPTSQRPRTRRCLPPGKNQEPWGKDGNMENPHINMKRNMNNLGIISFYINYSILCESTNVVWIRNMNRKCLYIQKIWDYVRASTITTNCPIHRGPVWIYITLFPVSATHPARNDTSGYINIST